MGSPKQTVGFGKGTADIASNLVEYAENTAKNWPPGVGWAWVYAHAYLTVPGMIEEKEPVDKDGWPISPPADKKSGISLHGFCGIATQKPEPLPTSPRLNSRIIIRLVLLVVVVLVVILILKRI